MHRLQDRFWGPTPACGPWLASSSILSCGPRQPNRCGPKAIGCMRPYRGERSPVPTPHRRELDDLHQRIVAEGVRRAARSGSGHGFCVNPGTFSNKRRDRQDPLRWQRLMASFAQAPPGPDGRDANSSGNSKGAAFPGFPLRLGPASTIPCPRRPRVPTGACSVSTSWKVPYVKDGLRMQAWRPPGRPACRADGTNVESVGDWL